jgi:hypothetical protein
MSAIHPAFRDSRRNCGAVVDRRWGMRPQPLTACWRAGGTG